jgi:hypothetical protein
MKTGQTIGKGIHESPESYLEERLKSTPDISPADIHEQIATTHTVEEKAFLIKVCNILFDKKFRNVVQHSES